MIVGPSGSGKTQLTESLFTEGTVFEGRKIRLCHYSYDVWQSRFDCMKGQDSLFHEGIPEVNHTSRLVWQKSGRCPNPRRSHGRRRKRQTCVGSFHPRIPSSEHHGALLVSRFVSTRKICQDHL